MYQLWQITPLRLAMALEILNSSKTKEDTVRRGGIVGILVDRLRPHMSLKDLHMCHILGRLDRPQCLGRLDRLEYLEHQDRPTRRSRGEGGKDGDWSMSIR